MLEGSVRIAGFFLLIVFVSSSVAAQHSKKARESFQRVVAASQRTSFCSVLHRGVSAVSTDNWADFYDVLLPSKRGSVTKQEFVEARENHDGARMEFRIKEVRASTVRNLANSNGQWDVLGCAVFRDERNKFTGSAPARIAVYLDNGQWFTDYLEETIVLDGYNECPKLDTAVSISLLCDDAK